MTTQKIIISSQTDMHPAIAMQDFNEDDQNAIDLTPEEELILSYLSLGFSHQQIANEIAVSPDHVKHLCESIFKKTDTHNLLQVTTLNYSIRIKAYLNQIPKNKS